MTKRIVVDPITRIEGHLRMEADIENGVITDAFSTGTMIRGIEIIVKDAIPATFGHTWAEYAESVPPYIRSVLSGQSKMRYTSSFRRMPSR